MDNFLRKNTSRFIHIITGASGAGKSLLLTNRIIYQECLCYLLNYIYKDDLPQPLRVWTNYPVEPFEYIPKDDGALWPDADKPVILTPEPLNIYKLYAFDPEMRWGYLDIDELDQIADRQDWQNGGQKLLMKILRQIRKRHISLVANIQSINWLNPRFYFHIDMETLCRDASFTAWGKMNNVAPGVQTFLYTKDISGFKTGHPYEETGRIYQKKLFGRPLHTMYDTDREFNIWDSMENISIKKRKVEIDPFARENDENGEEDNYPQNVKILEETLRECLKQKLDSIKVKDFYEMAVDNGIAISRQEAVGYIENVHNVKQYAKMGYPYLNLKEVKNINIKKGRKKSLVGIADEDNAID